MIPERADVSVVRRNNLEVVVRHLGTARSASRADIAAATGLTRSTVSRHVAELIELGFVHETGIASGAVGRPGTTLELNGRGVLCVGAEVTTDSITVVVRDLAGNHRAERRHSADAVSLGPERCVTRLARLWESAIADATLDTPGSRVAGYGIAIPGVVDPNRSTIVEAPNLRWRDIPLAAMVHDALTSENALVVIDNDANYAARAEFLLGEHAGTPNLVYIIGEVGIGGGILVGGVPLPGNGGRAGEVGHMCIDPNGPRCGCGRRGCWEALIGLNAFLAPFEVEAGSLRPEIRIKSIVARAKSGDKKVLRALAALGSWIGLGAANIVNVLSPEIIILGGYFPYVGEWIMPSIQGALRDRVMVERDHPDGLVALSTLHFDAAAVGAALDCAERVLSDPAQLATIEATG